MTFCHKFVLTKMLENVVLVQHRWIHQARSIHRDTNLGGSTAFPRLFSIKFYAEKTTGNHIMPNYTWIPSTVMRRATKWKMTQFVVLAHINGHDDDSLVLIPIPQVNHVIFKIKTCKICKFFVFHCYQSKILSFVCLFLEIVSVLETHKFDSLSWIFISAILLILSSNFL